MEPRSPTFREALRFWLKLGFISFGGPSGQIAIMHAELVERKKWIGEARFMHALNFCMLLPGPEATQLATYCGWLLHGVRGGIAAGVLFVLPAAVLLWGLSWIYAAFGTLPVVAAVFAGLKPAVVALVLAALVRIGRRAVKTWRHAALAVAAFAALAWGRVPFPAVVAGAALAGWLARPRAGGFEPTPGANECRGVRERSGRRAAQVLGGALVLWWMPVVVAGLWQGWDGMLVRTGTFFSRAALVTFGGAYAVLPYVGQQAVEHYGWLTAPQMLDGLGLAETTPGPLIMVVQFVGFLGGWNHPGGLTPLVAATLGAAMTTWTTFVPCFLWILLGAPHIERLRGHRAVDATMSAVTAAVVGVILNLAVWFGAHVFVPASGKIDGFAVAVSVAAWAALQWTKAGVVTVVLASGLAGWGWAMVG